MKIKENILKERLKQLGSAAIAFSGGVDSTYLLSVASEVLREKVIAVTANAKSSSPWEIEEAEKFCKSIGVKHFVESVDEFTLSGYAENPPNRCYICKKGIFSKIFEVAKKNGIYYVIDGTNASDSGDYRPGVKALEELGVMSLLKDVGLTKAEIRELSKERNLPIWDKPSFACLASRFPYGTRLSPELFHRVDSAEEILRNLGFKQYRVRYHGDVARIELPKDDFNKLLQSENAKSVYDEFKKIGFKYVALDILGFRSGSMNEGI